MSYKIVQHETRWNVGVVKEPLIHRIHAYPAKFPAFITEKAVAVARENGVCVRTVADVFCGCGTTAYEAKKLGLNFWGCDINPVATLIARVKSSSHDIDEIKLAFDEIKLRYAKYLREVDCGDVPERLKYWFEEERQRELKALLLSIRALPNVAVREFFTVAFSNILKATSRWLAKSIKPQVDPSKITHDAWTEFSKQVTFMIKAVEQAGLRPKGKTQIKTKNLLTVSARSALADVIVTSPPYVTSYEYADLHQLSTLWLGYASDYRTLRKGTIGSMFRERESSSNQTSLNCVGRDIIACLREADKSKASASERYFRDMAKTVEKCKSILRPGGMVFFVIGDTEYKGVKVKNSEFLAQCMVDQGFENVTMEKRQITGKILTPYRNEKGRFSKDHNAAMKIYAEEYVLMGRKSNVGN